MIPLACHGLTHVEDTFWLQLYIFLDKYTQNCIMKSKYGYNNKFEINTFPIFYDKSYVLARVPTGLRISEPGS